MEEELHYQSAAQLARKLNEGSLSSVGLMEHLIQRTEALEPKVGAFLGWDSADALQQAEAADQRRAKGESLSPLDGLPVSLKNVIAVKDELLTCASRMLETYRSPYDAHVSEKLKAAGVILWGRLNMDEFAMGSSTENSAFHPTCNPWDLSRNPGGSSGGSAAAVAAGETPLSLGSDTGGSIRQPAAFCGIVGLKPTYGRVSRYGLAAFASSLDQIGPMGRSVEDVALLLQLIAGHDRRDSTCMNESVPDYRGALTLSGKPLRIGWPSEYFKDGLDPEVKSALLQAREFYRSQGCEVIEVSLPSTPLAVPVYYILATAEATSNLARYDGVRYGYRSPNAKDAIDMYFKSRGEAFGDEVKRRIILGNFVLSSGYYDAWYLRAQKVRTLIRQELLEVFKNVDVILTPTTPTPSHPLGEHRDDPLMAYLEDVYTIPANLAGLPGLSIPCGYTAVGLPIGMQLMARPFAEVDLLRLGHLFESAHPYAHAHPNL